METREPGRAVELLMVDEQFGLNRKQLSSLPVHFTIDVADIYISEKIRSGLHSSRPPSNYHNTQQAPPGCNWLVIKPSGLAQITSFTSPNGTEDGGVANSDNSPVVDL